MSHSSGIGDEPGDANARGGSTGVISCVVDADLRFHFDALRWYAVLRDVAGVPSQDLIVHAVDETDSEILNFLRSEGVSVQTIQSFDTRPPPHCNKICGALRLAERGVDGPVVLTDTDIAVLEDPRHVHVPPDAVASRIVGAPNPPLRILENVFAAAGLTVPGLEPLDLIPEELTVAGHGNGGFYIIPGGLLSTVAHSWAYWAKWLMDHVVVLEDFPRHVDQPSMALALSDLGITAQRLELGWNFPVHNPARVPAHPDRPVALHYHRNVDEHGLLKQTGVPVVDEQIAVANEAISRVWEEAAAYLPAPEGRTHEEASSKGGRRSFHAGIRRRLSRGRGSR